MSTTTARPDRTNNSAVVQYTPPPRALWMPSESALAELREQQRQAQDDAAESNRKERLWSKVRLAAGIGGWALAGGLALALVSVFPLRRDVHHLTVLNSTDQTAAVFRSTWDLPESKRESLILGTAAQYVRACESYSWVEAQNDYNYCAGMSYAGRLREYVASMDPNVASSPQAILGRDGWKRVVTGKPVRTAENALVVPFTVVAARPNESPVCARRLMRLAYVPVETLPTTLHLQYPTADILFFSASVDPDPTPLDPAACRV